MLRLEAADRRSVKALTHATSPIRGEIGVVWINPANGDLTGCPPLVPWLRESVVFAYARSGPLKAGNRTVICGWSIIKATSQKRNLILHSFQRRVFYRYLRDCRVDAPVPFNAIDPRSVAPGAPGRRVEA
jgi:hypothetical protein